MNTQPPKLWRRYHGQSSPSQPAILPDELIIEILSWLTVKFLMQMKCVSKSWKTIISDPKFVKMHLSRSARNPYMSTIFFIGDHDYSFVHFPITRLMENRSITLPKDPYYRLGDKVCRMVLNSCNGLIFLRGFSHNESTKSKKVLFRFWNPATRIISDILGSDFNYDNSEFYEFVFGYDKSTDTYKVVALNSSGNNVRVFSLGDNVWRTIQSFPVATLPLLCSSSICSGVYLNCTVNWLACMRDHWTDNRVLQHVIISLDLGTETYTQMLPPEPFEQKLSRVGGRVCVLMGSLCFYHDLKGTDFVICQMKEFGNEKSWTQFLKFSYRNVHMNYKIGHSPILRLTPLHLSENGDTLVLAANLEDRAILYNRRTNKAKKTRINTKICWLREDYVESLVPTS